MQTTGLLSVVRALLERPTAPFHEEAVRDAIVAQLRTCPHVTFKHDAYGNVIARYRRGTRSRARWAFAAHMDHPGWVRAKNDGWQFLVSVAERYLINPRRREFGEFAMWDLPAFELKDGRIYSRACDDLLGCAEIICLFHELEAVEAEVHCLGVFSRAEEVGFWGAIQLARAGTLPRNITVLSLETSAPRGSAEIGRGPIVRVGDRLSIFDSGETARVMNVAAANKIPVQRCLLDGGSCEASAYQLYGYRSVAASIGLGNYHNCATDGTVQCEYVSLEDYANMVRLCVAVVLAREESDPAKALRDSLEKRAEAYSSLYRKI